MTTKKRTPSILLVIALALSLLPGMRATALADQMTGTASSSESLSTVAVNVGGPDGAVTAAPRGKDMTYTGTALELVTAGEASGGAMRYALGTDATTAPAASAYSADIPIAVGTGTYYVWFKVAGDAGHGDSEPAVVTSTISLVDKAMLKEAIAIAESYYNSITGNTLFTEAAAALKQAIDAAKAVAGDVNASESYVGSQITAVYAAVEAARSAEKAITKQFADEVAAKTVADTIKKLPANPGVNDEDDVKAARAAYDRLTEAQKALVPADVLGMLAAAEQSVEEARKQTGEEGQTGTPEGEGAADEAAAKAVAEAISALPDEAGAKDRDSVAEARAAYEGLTEAQKALVPADVLDRLAAAERQVEEALEEGTGKAQIGDCEITVEDQTYTGNALEPAVTVVHGDVTLVRDADYAVEYEGNTNAGSAKATVTGMGQYVGSKAVTFRIAKAKMADCKLSVKDQVYAGKKLEPGVTVMFGSTKLKKGRDYTVSYGNNNNVGTATATVKGKGNFTGKARAKFVINPKATAITGLSVGETTIKVKWEKQKSATGFEIEYSRNKKFADSKTITVTNKKGKTASAKIADVKIGKKYYLRVRVYQTVGRKTYYSNWSKAKPIR